MCPAYVHQMPITCPHHMSFMCPSHTHQKPITYPHHMSIACPSHAQDSKSGRGQVQQNMSSREGMGTSTGYWVYWPTDHQKVPGLSATKTGKFGVPSPTLLSSRHCTLGLPTTPRGQTYYIWKRLTFWPELKYFTYINPTTKVVKLFFSHLPWSLRTKYK